MKKIEFMSPEEQAESDKIRHAAWRRSALERCGGIMTDLKVEGKLLHGISKVVRAVTGYGYSEQKEKEKAMLDLFKEFKDWLSYNYPSVELEPLQEDLMKLALRNWSVRITKTAGKAAMKNLASLFLTGKIS